MVAAKWCAAKGCFLEVLLVVMLVVRLAVWLAVLQCAGPLLGEVYWPRSDGGPQGEEMLLVSGGRQINTAKHFWWWSVCECWSHTFN